MSDRTHIPVVGIVGGIGSGKSAVARWVAARHGDVLLINGDELGHEVLGLPEVKEAVRRRFGDSVFEAGGSVDRKALGQLVFGAAESQQAARRDLEGIVHPKIREMLERLIAAAPRAGKTRVLLDAAVLFEAGWNDLCHAIVFIDAPRDERLQRVRAARGWDESELRRRESSQLSVHDKQNRAQFRVNNARSLDDAGAQLEHILTQFDAKVDT